MARSSSNQTLLPLPGNGNAAAVWHFKDSMESNAASNWSFDRLGAGDGWINDQAPHSAHTGTHSASIRSWGAPPAFSSVGRTVRLPGLRPCTASVFLGPLGFDRSDRIQVNLEVIEPATWTYVSLRPIVITQGGWQQFSTAWTSSPRDVVVRVSVLGPTDRSVVDVRVDDLKVSCG